MLNIGIIGAGIIARSHLWAIRRTGVCKTACIVDVNEEKAREAAEKNGCPYFTDYKKIDVSLDAVIINLPHFLHKEVTCWFLERGVHVLIEKPMANSYADCLEMIKASEKSGARLAVGHVQRYFDSNIWVKRYYDAGEFGRLCMTEESRHIYYFDEKRPKWFLNKEQAGGGILMNYGAHALDKLYYLMGSEITEMHSNIGNLLNDSTVEGHAQLFFRFENGVSSAVTFSGYHGFDAHETTYYFTEGAVRVSDSSLLYTARNGRLEKVEFPEEHHCFSEQLVDFVRLTEGGETRIASGEYGAKIIKTLENIYGGSI